MKLYIVTGPGFVEYIRATSYESAIYKVAMARRVNRLMLCVELARAA